MGSRDAIPDDLELIFLGTGTSSTLPHVDCLTAPPGAKACRTCLSTLHPEGFRNKRRNTSAVLRVPAPARNGELATIVIDVGKSFQPAAVEWFPKYGLRRIDAVLITHAHADAMNGLDDLRGWTLNGAIQSHVDLYVSVNTFEEVRRAFPYLVSKEFASGGGDVPEFKWHIIEDRVPFEIGDTGIVINPFTVHHGRIFSLAPPVGFIPSPGSVSPSSTNPSSPRPGTPIRPPAVMEVPSEAKQVLPYLCFGFVINNLVTYISDVSHITEDTWEYLRTSLTNAGAAGTSPVLVLDCLRLEPHPSHLSIRQSVETARRFAAARTYLVGFSHEISHEEYRTVLEQLDGTGRIPGPAEVTPMVKRSLESIDDGEPLWVRPGFDGLRVLVGEDGEVRDSEYH